MPTAIAAALEDPVVHTTTRKHVDVKGLHGAPAKRSLGAVQAFEWVSHAGWEGRL